MPMFNVEMSMIVHVVVAVEAESYSDARWLSQRITPQDCGSSLDIEIDEGVVESCDTRDSEITIHSVDLN